MLLLHAHRVAFIKYTKVNFCWKKGEDNKTQIAFGNMFHLLPKKKNWEKKSTLYVGATYKNEKKRQTKMAAILERFVTFHKNADDILFWLFVAIFIRPPMEWQIYISPWDCRKIFQEFSLWNCIFNSFLLSLFPREINCLTQINISQHCPKPAM